MPEFHLILDNVRSTYNVGSLLRSADGLGVCSVFTIGITPHMKIDHDDRLPHIIDRAEREIRKTALGAEKLMDAHFAESSTAIQHFAEQNITLLSIEVNDNSKPISEVVLNNDSVYGIVVGHERNGVSDELLKASSDILHIPMRGTKQSFNVSIAGALAMYELSSKFDTIQT